jgi:hypothetical protein
MTEQKQNKRQKRMQKNSSLQLSDTQKGNPNFAHYGAYLWQIITLNYNSAALARTAEFFPCASN